MNILIRINIANAPPIIIKNTASSDSLNFFIIKKFILKCFYMQIYA